MIIGFMASKVSMSQKLIIPVMRSIAGLALEYSKDSSDVQWCRMYLMALINIIQVMNLYLAYFSCIHFYFFFLLFYVVEPDIQTHSYIAFTKEQKG